MNKAMQTEESNQEIQPLSLEERFLAVLADRRAFEAARLELGIEGAIDLYYSDADSDWPSLIQKHIDLSGCQD
jgi:hypothetical protein